ncbi:unnamed protein product [Closterium sp. NIES-54]
MRVVPYLQYNIFSSAQLMRFGVDIPSNCQDKTFELYYKNTYIGKADDDGGVFVLNFSAQGTTGVLSDATIRIHVKTPGKIKFVAAASGALLPVIGVGNAKVMGANGEVVGLGNVLLVEGLSANLLSVHRLQKSKAEVTFGPTSCRAKLGKMLLWNLEEKSSCIKDLWQLPIIPWKGKPPAIAKAAGAAKATAGGEESAPTAAAMDAVKKVQQPQQPHREVLAGVDATAAWAKASSGSGEADWEMWHERLCHVNIPMLQKLVKDGCLKGLEVKGGAKEIGNCPTCLETKFTKFPFSSSTGPAKAPLALVHMDVVGPTRALSLSGSRYFLTIVDDHTRAVWVYPLKTKGEVAAAVLKEWMPRAQRESGHKVKVIRTDNGGEFIGADVEKELKRKGIQHQLTVPYNPEQNGVAERFNRTLQEGARTLIGRAGLPDPFWVTALRQVVVVKNREKRGKLEASGRWGVHLGLAKDHKGWLIWDLTSQQLTVSRDVKFLESLYYKEWKQQQQQKLPMTPLIVEADEVQRPSRQVEVSVSKEEISGVTDDGGEPEVEQQQQQQQEEQGAPQGAGRTADRPRRDVRPPNRLTYASRGKPKVRLQRGAADLSKGEMLPTCYTDASFNSVKADGTSIGGYVCLFGGGAVSWRISNTAGGTARASGGTGVAGPAGTGAAGATGAGAAGGVGAGGSAGAGTSEGAGVGAVGARGAARAGATARGTGAVPAGSGGATQPRPYFVPLLEQVLGLPPSTGSAPPIACPQPVPSQSQLQPASPLPAPSPYTGPTGGLTERLTLMLEVNELKSCWKDVPSDVLL